MISVAPVNADEREASCGERLRVPFSKAGLNHCELAEAAAPEAAPEFAAEAALDLGRVFITILVVVLFEYKVLPALAKIAWIVNRAGLTPPFIFRVLQILIFAGDKNQLPCPQLGAGLSLDLRHW